MRTDGHEDISRFSQFCEHAQKYIYVKRKEIINAYFVPPEPGVLSMDRVHQSESAMLLENIP
jgi:hypothetical protein